MKAKKSLLTSVAIIMFLLITGLSCEKETLTSDVNHTWKFDGFGNLSNSSFEKADPSDCEDCYVLTFLKSGKLTGRTTTNTISGEFQIDAHDIEITNLIKTEIIELGSGEKYTEAISLTNKYEIMNNTLKLYYNQNQNYLQFKLSK